MNYFKMHFQYFVVLWYFFALALIKFPPMYILHSSSFTTTHVLAKLSVFIVTLFLLFDSRNRKQIQKHRIFFFVFLYFFLQSLSVVNATNMGFFLKQYQNTITEILLFTSAFLLMSTKLMRTLLMSALLFIGTITVLFEVSFFMFPELFISIANIVIQHELMDLYLYNVYYSDRHNLYLSIELFLPIFYWALVTSYKEKKIIKSLLYGILSIAIIIISIMSKFRTRFIQMSVAILGVIGSIKTLKGRVTLVFFIGATSIITLKLLTSMNYLTVIDRLLLSDEQEDVATITSRYEQLLNAVEIVRYYPLFGAGLGQYKTFVDHDLQYGISDPYRRKHFTAASDAPHSVISEKLSETGFVGIISYALLIGVFLYHDRNYFLQSGGMTSTRTLILSSWTIFTYSLINPFNTIFLTGWFWFLRGLIESSHTQKKLKNYRK